MDTRRARPHQRSCDDPDGLQRDIITDVDLFDFAYEQQVRAAAARLDERAASIRVLVRRLVAATAGCGWDGTGARAFGLRAREASATLLQATDGIEEATAALRRHAVAVGHEQAEREAAQREAERRVTELVGELLGIGHRHGHRPR